MYTGLYTFADGQMQVLKEQTACPVEEILQQARNFGKKVHFLGDGVPVYRSVIEEVMQKTGTPYVFAPAHMSRQRAGAVGIRAFEYLRAGKTETAAEHAPVYLRKSQAERELLVKGKTLAQ